MTRRSYTKIPLAALFLTAVFAMAPVHAQAVAPIEAVAQVDYGKRVFDTSADAGKLTCRFLRLTINDTSGDVRAGDCSVFTSPEGLVMVVDCGNVLSCQEALDSLGAMGVRKIDIFVASHPHADHIGGFAKLAEAYEIGQVYMNYHEYDSGTYRAMMKIIAAKDIPMRRLREGDRFAFGPSVAVKCYNPPAGFDFSSAPQTAASIANEGSLCLKLTYGASSFLSSGDMYIGSERRAAEIYGDALRADVSKMNHHGDSTSNSTEFISAVKPKVTVGMNEGILSFVVNMRYRKVGSRTFYNCVDGAVKVATPGDGTYDVQSQYVRELTTIGAPSSDGHYLVK